MKYVTILISFIILYGCRTEQTTEIGDLSVVGLYCKYPDNDFLYLSFELFQNDILIKSDTLEFSEKSIIKGLPFGSYSIKFNSIYNNQETIQFELKNKSQEVKLCIDQLNIKLKPKKLLVDQLKTNEKLKIDFFSLGCFHLEESSLEIIKMKNHYIAKLGKDQIVMSEEQFELIREFETELRTIKPGYCTTSNKYNLTTEEGKTYELIDNSCMWYGYDNLIKTLGLKNKRT